MECGAGWLQCKSLVRQWWRHAAWSCRMSAHSISSSSRSSLCTTIFSQTDALPFTTLLVVCDVLHVQKSSWCKCRTIVTGALSARSALSLSLSLSLSRSILLHTSLYRSSQETHILQAAITSLIYTTVFCNSHIYFVKNRIYIAPHGPNFRGDAADCSFCNNLYRQIYTAMIHVIKNYFVVSYSVPFCHYVCYYYGLYLSCWRVELGLEPEFDEPFTNVTVTAGHTATLPCSIHLLGKHKVQHRKQIDIFVLYYRVMVFVSCVNLRTEEVYQELRRHSKDHSTVTRIRIRNMWSQCLPNIHLSVFLEVSVCKILPKDTKQPNTLIRWSVTRINPYLELGSWSRSLVF